MRRIASLRSMLLLLVAASMLPLLVLSLVLGFVLVRHEEDTVRRAAMDRNRTFSTAVDARMRGHIAALRALAASAALERGDVAAFANEALRVLETQPEWRSILLLSPSGQQLTDTRFAYGTRLPMDTDRGALEAAVLSRAVSIGDLGREPAAARLGIPVRLPIVRDAAVVYVLESILEPTSLTQLMREQGYPGEWTIGLVDSTGQIIARLPERPPGERLPPYTWDRLRVASEGWFLTRTLEGTSSYSAFKRSAFTNWTVGTAIPAAQVKTPLWHAALTFGLGALLSLALAILFAWRIGRGIAEPIVRIAAAARDLGRSPAPQLGEVRQSARVREVLEVASAFEAAASIAEREALRQREQEALRAADQAKDEFLAMLGHELRNPLSAITASAHVLRLSKPGADAAARAHAVIDRQARQMTRLVEDLLDVSRLAMRKVTLQRERTELAGLVSHVVATWRGARAPRAERPLVVHVLPAEVDVDRVRLEQVVTNLLDNAEKFSDQGAEISVALEAQAHWAVLKVRDRGQGIPADELPHIFELFVQGKQSFHRPHGGIGLGLTLVKRLVEMHGGIVTAESAGRGQGATFTVRLPLAAAGAAAAPEPASSPGAHAQRRVLIIEDNDDGRAVLEAMLTLEGHTVRSESRGVAGVEAASEFAPHIALVDIGLPDIDGYEVARRIRALRLPGSPRLVAISGYGQPRDAELAYEAGFDLHLVKPVSAEFLRNVFAAMSARSGAAS